MTEKLFLSWHEYIEDCYTIVKDVRDKGLSDLPILVISRGGFIPGLLISHGLENQNMKVIGVSSYDHTNQLDKITITQEPNTIYNKVLVVDDLVDTGRTLDEVKNYLRQKNENVIIHTAVIYSKLPSYKVDCKFKDIDPNTWIVFPYEDD